MLQLILARTTDRLPYIIYSVTKLTDVSYDDDKYEADDNDYDDDDNATLGSCRAGLV